jgi:hypothetical protein
MDADAKLEDIKERMGLLVELLYTIGYLNSLGNGYFVTDNVPTSRRF